MLVCRHHVCVCAVARAVACPRVQRCVRHVLERLVVAKRAEYRVALIATALKVAIYNPLILLATLEEAGATGAWCCSVLFLMYRLWGSPQCGCPATAAYFTALKDNLPHFKLYAYINTSAVAIAHMLRMPLGALPPSVMVGPPRPPRCVVSVLSRAGPPCPRSRLCRCCFSASWSCWHSHRAAERRTGTRTATVMRAAPVGRRRRRRQAQGEAVCGRQPPCLLSPLLCTVKMTMSWTLRTKRT